jgi:hypothetical protein
MVKNTLIVPEPMLTYAPGVPVVLSHVPPKPSGNLVIQFDVNPDFFASSSRDNVTVDIEESTDWGQLFAKLDGLLNLPNGWDGYRAAPPNLTGRYYARSFLQSLAQGNYVPYQVVPSVIGGVGVNRRRGNKKVYVEFNNNGKVHALYSDGTSPPRVEQVQPDKSGFHILIRRMRAYLDE